MMNRQFSSRLARRQLLITVFAAFAVSVVVSLVQLAMDYRREERLLKNFAEQSLDSFKFAAATAAFHLDNSAAEEVLRGLMHYQQIDGARIENEFGEVLAAAGYFSANKKPESSPADADIRRVGPDDSRNGTVNGVIDGNIYRVELSFNDIYDNVGILSIHTKPLLKTGDFWERLLLSFASDFVRSALVALVLFFLFFNHLTRRLLALNAFVSDIDFSAPPEQLPRTETHNDEVDDLRQRVNEMLVSLHQLLSEQRASQVALEQEHKRLNKHKDALEQEIDNRRAVEKERQKLIAELEAKNAELERYTYTVSHDLKSPLITIKGFLAFLEESALNGDTEQLKKDIHRIEVAAEKMQSLLEDLLELSRIGRLVNEPEPFDLADAVQDALERVTGELLEAQGQVSTHFEPAPVEGDYQRIVEVIQNLLSNSIKYRQPDQPLRIDISTGMADTAATLTVEDNGIGIEPKYLPKVFGLFEQLNPNAEGSGVGLALAERIVHFHGGSIEVDSAGLGQGCRFSLTLPAKSTPSE